MSNFKLAWRISGKIFIGDDNWRAFLRLAHRHHDVVDEVAMYVTDDIFPNLTPMDDRKKQAEICAERIAELHQKGITAGLNVWPSLNLYPVERKFYPDMPRMVGIDGKVIDTVACPTSKEFTDYLCEKYTILAKAKPDFIWVDDDMRFTHTDGNYPCFCERCVKGFKNGAFENRSQLVAALNNPENRDLRIAWSSYGADRLAALCAALRAAVDRVDENIDLALMTVGATHTTFSGDYISKCMTALRSKRGRPGHDCYSDRQPDKLMWKALEVGRQVLEYPETVTDILWEEDSHPQGQLIKSFKTRQNEISLALMMGCNGVAFNHAAMNGDIDKRLGREVDALHLLRPRWEKFLAFSMGLPLKGMWPHHDWFMTAKAKKEYAWLKENPFGEGPKADCDISLPGLLGPFGIALTTQRQNASATLLSGKTITAFTEEELKEVFSGNVYMDADALAALEEMGYAHWAGVKINPLNLPNKPCVMTNNPFNGPFGEEGYRGTHGIVTHTLLPLSDKVEWLGYRPTVFDEGDLLYISKYQNSLGGKVIVNAYNAFEYTDSPCNIYQFASMAKWFGCPIVLKYGEDNAISRVEPYIRTDGKKAAVMLLNASLDETNPFEIGIKGNMKRGVILGPDGGETPLDCRTGGDRLYLSVPIIAPWDIAFILVE